MTGPTRTGATRTGGARTRRANGGGASLLLLAALLLAPRAQGGQRAPAPEGQRTAGGKAVPAAPAAGELRARAEPSAGFQRLCRVLSETPARDEQGALLLRRRLVALGPEAAPELFRMLELVCELGGDGRHAFASPRAQALAAALGDLPGEALRRHLAVVAREALTRRTRECALCLLAELPGARDASDVELALALASAPLGAEAPSAALSERALGAVVARDEGVRAQVARAYERCGEQAAVALVGAAARAGGESGLELLLYWLGRRPALDGWILARASSLEVASPASAEARGAVRRALSRPEPEIVALAARVAGRIGDDEAVESLLALLEHEDESVRTGAHLGLCALAGRRCAFDARAWRAWYERERAWWEGGGGRVLERIARAPAPEVVELVGELSRRRLFRREAAHAVAGVLARSEPDLLRLACAALGALRVREVHSELEPLLEHSDAGVRAAAAEALRTLGVERAPSTAWR